MQKPTNWREAVHRIADAIATEAQRQNVVALSDASKISAHTTIDDDTLTEFAKGIARKWFPGRAAEIDAHQKFHRLGDLATKMGFDPRS